MEKRVTMTLRSDTIFGSGVSIPGGEDIAVKLDEKGAPYLSGSTFKGLLRESVENWLLWEGQSNQESVLKQLFGAEDKEDDTVKDNWFGAEGDRRVFVSPLTLVKEQNPKDLLYQRTFTSIDSKTGTVKNGSLRVASCVRKGTQFQGSVSFAAEDQELVESALQCIRYVGTSRTRGFGQVRIDISEAGKDGRTPQPTGSGHCLSYQLELLENVRVTDLSESHNTFLGCLRWIPGAAVRGAVLSRLFREDAHWFEVNKATLLQEVRFTDLIPGNPGTKPAIPVPMGFYENKLGGNFYSLLVKKDVDPRTKRAKLGSFCTLEEFAEGDEPQQRIRSWSPKLGAETRINLPMQHKSDEPSGGLFQTSHLLRGQKAEGMVFFPKHCSEELRSRVAAALGNQQGRLRLGANIHSGFGLCQLTRVQWLSEAPERTAYGYQPGSIVGKTVYMMLLSPLMLVGKDGEPRGLMDCKKDGEPRGLMDCDSKDEDWLWLSELLGVPVTDVMCSTTVSRQQGFNRRLGTRLPIRTYYQPGCVFRITCAEAPALERIRELEDCALGAYQEEGWGRVIFLPDLEKIKGRWEKSSRESIAPKQAERVQKRRARAEWLLKDGRARELQGELSNSQLGTVQEWIAEAKAQPELNTAKTILWKHFENRMEKNPAERNLYQGVWGFVQQVLEGQNLPDFEGKWNTQERLQLLIDLIKLSRREESINGQV